MSDSQGPAFAPPAPPQPPQQTATMAPQPPQPPVKRKGKGCLIAIVIIVLLLCALVAGGVFLFTRATQEKDLGIAYSQADVDTAYAKLGVEFTKEPPDDGAEYERVYSGEKPMDVTLTESEISALMSYNHNASYWPIKSMQVDITGADSAQASAVVAYAGRDWPVYVAGSGGIGGQSLWVDFASAEVAGMEVPAQYFDAGESFLAGIVNARLGRIPGLNVESLEVTDEGVHVVGSIWETVEWVKSQ
ncbi:MAG: hypothetical protein ACYC77_04140 [Coriobacteriia bacterium]